MTIIPAIDLIDGKCVRLTQGDYAQKTVYGEDPVAMALSFEKAGLKRLHLVDLDGAKAGKTINLAVLKAIREQSSLEIDFGGGITSQAELDKVLAAGANWATIGSMAAKQPAVFADWIKSYGAQVFLVGADVKAEQIAVSGWTETTAWNLFDFLQHYRALGIESFFCTDISKDGKMQGPAMDLYQRILRAEPGLSLIASGGVSQASDLMELAQIGCSGAIVGKAFYEGKISLATLAELNN